VTSAQKTRANRANARASTGPRTAEGRNRSARNARRHGLSLPVLADPILSQDVAELTREIAGSTPSRELYELARRVAETQIDLRRVRYARFDLLSSALGDPDYESPSKLRTKANCGRQLATKREGPQKFASILSDMARQLAVMDPTNDARCRGVSLPCELLMQRECKATRTRSRGVKVIIQLKIVDLAERSQNSQSFQEASPRTSAKPARKWIT